MKRTQRKEAVPREIMELSSRACYMVFPASAVSVGLPGCPNLGLTLFAWLFGLYFELPQVCECQLLEHQRTSGSSESFSYELYGITPLGWSVGTHKIA